MNEVSALPSGKPKRRPDVWVRSSGKENSIYDPDSQELHLLNETALAIWEICDGATTPDEMVEAICDLSGLAVEIVEEDVHRTLAQFRRLGLITWEDAAT